MSAIAGFSGSVAITSTPSVNVVYATLDDSGDHQTYTMHDTNKRYWDPSQPAVIHVSTDGGTTYTDPSPSTYTLQYVGGICRFTSPRGASDLVRITVNYLPYSTFIQMKNWEVAISMDMLDSTTFGSRWKSYTPALQGATIKLGQFYVDNTFSNILSTAEGSPLIASCHTGRNSGNERYDAFVKIKQDDIKLAVAGLIEESLDLQVVGQLYYFSS